MKKFLPDLIVILVFIALSFAYFFPAFTQGRILFQHDSAAGVGAGQEAKEYYERTGERTRWTNALFGGMPTYQLSPSYQSTAPLQFAQKFYRLFLPEYVWLVFIMMFGFYILMRSVGASVWLSALGGIIWAFSSYFFIIIAAGHIWKFVTLAYIPPTIAGIILIYRKKYLLGGIVTALFVAFQILSNHVQMSYYFLFVILFMVTAFFAEALRRKELPHFFKASAVLAVAGLIGISTNVSNLYHTYQYSKETIRGKSELKEEGPAAKQTSGGLDRDYITQWSYGIGETFSLLIPNVKGGASVPLSQSKKAMEKADPRYTGIYSQLSQYFGEQPGTSGPVYVGAFVLMLFVLGLFIVKGPLKYALAAATVFSILLAWGKNFMGLTDFFIDYVPMYDKFRAVSSILVIAEFTIPFLAVLTLKEIISKPSLLQEKIKYLYISFGLTGGIALLFAVAPRLFFSSYIPEQEMYSLQQGLPKEHLIPILANLEEMRIHLFTSDAWRSFFIISAGTALLFAFRMRKIKAAWMIAGIAVICLADMWPVNKRYLHDDQFVAAEIKTEEFRRTKTDEFILQDSLLNYRVLNFAGSTFNENNTSYWHKSIGGYHAAKLRRYQELIERHIAKEMQAVYREASNPDRETDDMNPEVFPVLNMLNTKYFIFPGEKGQTIPVENSHAYGNAWFVDKVEYVNNANEEINALNSLQPARTAVADVRFKEILKGATEVQQSGKAVIRLLTYEPNRLVYETSSPEDGVALFSEIYYPGWKASIDGTPTDIARANYILRALHIPAGKHTVEMRFTPNSIKATEAIAYAGLLILFLAIIALVVKTIKEKRNMAV